MKSTVLVCGGGNGGHIITGLASSRGVAVRVLSLYNHEANRWQEITSENDMEIVVQAPDSSTRYIRARPDFVTKDPEIAVPGADIIIVTVPAYCHETYLKAIVPHLTEGVIIVGLPSQMGFEFQCFDIFREKFWHCIIVSAESLPWACRINDFGLRATILGTKSSLACSIINPTNKPTNEILSSIQGLIGDSPTLYLLSSYMALNLMAKSYVHPPIMFARWKDYDGVPLKEKPLFYQGIDQFGADLLTQMSDEILQTARVIEETKPNADMNKVTALLENFFKFYEGQIKNKTNFLTAFRSNRAYDGLVHPMKSVNAGFVPDFGHRFMIEDVPFGMCVFRGIAEIVGVPTPAMDEVILWYQKVVGEEYLLDGRLKGKDVIKTRAPQRYGLYTLEELFGLQK